MYTTHLTLIIPAVVALVATFVSALFLKDYMYESGVISPDHNKKGKPILPTSGGLAMVFGFTVGMLTYVFGASFRLYYAAASLDLLFAAVLSVLLIAMVGFLDDVNVSKKMVKSTDMMDLRRGFRHQWIKPLLTFIGAVPLMAINAGVSTIALPFLGTVNLGILFPLIVLPLAIVFVANAFNLMGGFDGINTGGATIATLALFLYSITWGTYNGAVLSAILLTSVVALLWFNKFPASLLPGDSFTFAFGGAYVATVVIGNMEAFGAIVFLPWIIEFVLHARKKFKVSDLGVLQKDGTFKSKYGGKIYGWTHIFMNMKRSTEWEVSLYFWIVCAAFALLAFGMKMYGFL